MSIGTAGDVSHSPSRAAAELRNALEAARRPVGSPRAGHPVGPPRWRVYARPSKWIGAARRRAFVAGLPRRVVLAPRGDVEHVGTPYGGWPVPLGMVDRDSVVYSVGAGEDVSFDLGLVERRSCEVHSFDPTEGAARHVASNARDLLNFHAVAVWTHDGTLRMHRAANPEHIALSAVNLQRTRQSVEVPCRSIESLRSELGHERIDVLKLTVDGGEYELIPRLQLSRWQTRVLVVAFHHNRPVREALRVIAALGAQGMVPVARRNTGFAFARLS